MGALNHWYEREQLLTVLFLLDIFRDPRSEHLKWANHFQAVAERIELLGPSSPQDTPPDIFSLLNSFTRYLAL